MSVQSWNDAAASQTQFLRYLNDPHQNWFEHVVGRLLILAVLILLCTQPTGTGSQRPAGDLAISSVQQQSAPQPAKPRAPRSRALSSVRR
jgi:hypothetical protein